MATLRSPGYWASLIVRIRDGMSWSQARFADEVGSNRETVSRWERGARLPDIKARAKIEAIAQKLNPASIHGWATVVAASPFPMILTDRNSYVLAASASSGFHSGKNVIEQTPTAEREHYTGFSDAVLESGFWDQPGREITYEFNVGDAAFSAVVVSIGVQGKIYALVQRIDRSNAGASGAPN